MRYYFLIIGILCILYYLLLCLYSRRTNSTFARFWLAAGGVHLILGCAPLSVSAYRLLGCAAALLWILFLSVEIRIVSAMKKRCRRQVDYVLILGAQVRGTWITDSLKRRLDAALDYLSRFPDAEVIVSGGRGSGEDISEADAMAFYLMDRGVEESKIIKEDRSTSTRENLRFSRRFLDAQKDSAAVVTNDFHIYRALLTARREGYVNVYAVPASSNPVFQINYLVREFFAVAAMYLPGRIKAQRDGHNDTDSVKKRR